MTDNIFEGGEVHGIYPGGDQGLSLDPVPGDDSSYPTVNVRINTDINEWGRVSSHTILYYKRRDNPILLT
jgi:hypothetical protein